MWDTVSIDLLYCCRLSHVPLIVNSIQIDLLTREARLGNETGQICGIYYSMLRHVQSIQAKNSFFVIDKYMLRK